MAPFSSTDPSSPCGAWLFPRRGRYAATPGAATPLRRELLDRVRKCRSNAFSDARILEDQAESLASNGWVGPASEELNGGVDCWVEGGRKTGV